MPKQSKAQQGTIARVMHEYKHGELESSSGRKVRSREQAVAIALHEAGASRDQSSKEKKRSLARTKRKEAAGKTAQAEKEGKAAQDRVIRKGSRGSRR